MPAASREALAACPFVVVSDVVETTDTSVHAHVRLPAAALGREGPAPSPIRTARSAASARSWTRPARRNPIGGSSRRSGGGWGGRAPSPYDRPAEIWREHCRLSAYENDGARLFALPGHAAKGNADYDAMGPFRWGGTPFADGRFSTPDGRAQLVPVVQKAVAAPLKQWPMTLNTGRYRDQWHSMTRTGLSPKLARHREEPLVEIHPDDATRLGIVDGGLARVSSPQGDSIFRASIVATQRVGELFVPIHWTDRTATGGRAGLLPRPLADPISGQPGFKSTPVRIEPVATEWRGFIVARGELARRPDCLWATRIAVPGGTAWDMAGDGDAGALDALLPKGQRIEAIDAARGARRIAILDGGRLAAVLFVTRDGTLPPRDWLVAQLSEPVAAPTLLAGRAPGVQVDRGPIVCACFDVGLKTILAAIADQHLADVPAIGAALKAGTNCGSCRPALAKLLVTQGSANVA